MPQGKCTGCRIAYRWDGKPLLREAACPTCERPLEATTKHLRGRWELRTPRMRKTDGTGYLTTGDVRAVLPLARELVTAAREAGLARTDLAAVLPIGVDAAAVMIDLDHGEHGVVFRVTHIALDGAEHVAVAGVLYPTGKAVNRALCGALGHALRPTRPHERRSYSAGQWVMGERAVEQGRAVLARLGLDLAIV